jgi:hypothetical protein
MSEISKSAFERKYPHGSFERSLGTETIDACLCNLCDSAYRARMEARKSFSYYQKPVVQKRITPAQRAKARERAQEWRSNNLERARENQKRLRARKRVNA